jgi:hypothetical protein
MFAAVGLVLVTVDVQPYWFESNLIGLALIGLQLVIEKSYATSPCSRI